MLLSRFIVGSDLPSRKEAELLSPAFKAERLIVLFFSN